MGAQESIMQSTVTSLVAQNHRATGFGIFNTGFGLFWFIGSSVMGAVYSVSLPALVVMSVLLQLGAVPVLFSVRRRMR